MQHLPRRVVLGIAALAVAGPAAAQVRTEQLTRADATFPEPFTRIVGLRELSDGRLLIADQLERHISFLDFASGTVREIGRRGGGPGEYERPGALLPLPDDHTLLVDVGNMRLTRITPGGELDKESRPMMTPDGALIRPSFTDAQGRLYYSSAGIVTAGEASGSQPDSTPVLRWDPASDVTDTVATFYSPSAARGGGGTRISFGGGSGGVSLTGVQFRPFPTRDAWAAAPDGGVAVARSVGYRLDWFRESAVAPGPEITYDPVRIDDAEKEAWAEQMGNRTASFRTLGGSGSGGGTVQMPKPDLDEVDFPDQKPPFPASGVRTTPEGNVWVLRHQRARDESRPLYDVFDGSGQLIRRVRLPEGRRLVGFGDGVLYAVATDEDDLQWLERYVR